MAQNAKSKVGRPKLTHTLVEIVSAVKSSLLGEVLEFLPDIETTVGDLHRLFLQVEGLNENQAMSKLGLDLLLEIIVAFRKLHCLRSIGRLLDLSEHQDTQKIYISRAIARLGHYSTASKFLVQAARRFRIFANITISFIQLPALLFPPIEHPGIFAQKIRTSLLTGIKMKKVTANVKNHLEINKLAATCSKISLLKFKAHAEIQLLFHYETYTPALLPRVICSGKHACFLCELFVRLHGRFHLPSTHGRLYEMWILPAMVTKLSGKRAEEMCTVLESFASSIRQSLKNQILNANKPFTIPTESATLESVVSSEPSVDHIRRVDSGFEEGLETENQCTMESSASVSDLSGNYEDSVLEPYIMLVRGHSTLFDLSHHTKLVKVSTPRIHLTFSYATWTGSTRSLLDPKSSESAQSCELTLSWLDESDVMDPNSTIIDLAKYPGSFEETLNELTGSCDFFVVKGRDIVSIKTAYLGSGAP